MSPRTSRLVALATGLAYLLGYLWMLGDLGFGGSGWQLVVAGEWPTRWLQARGLFQFEGIAMLEAGGPILIVSPLNLAIAGALAALVALNVHGVFALKSAPAACTRPGAPVGLLASVPALLAGGACCAPALLLLVGIPGLGVIASLFGWLIPLSFALLIASRWWQRRIGAPPFRARTRPGIPEDRLVKRWSTGAADFRPDSPDHRRPNP